MIFLAAQWLRLASTCGHRFDLIGEDPVCCGKKKKVQRARTSDENHTASKVSGGSHGQVNSAVDQRLLSLDTLSTVYQIHLGPATPPEDFYLPLCWGHSHLYTRKARVLEG